MAVAALPAALAGLLGGLSGAASHLTGKVLISLGVGYVTYQGLDAMLEAAEGVVEAKFAALGTWPAIALQILGTCQIDTAAQIILSAYAAKLLLMGLQSGNLVKWVLK